MRIRWCERHKTVVHPRNNECCWAALAETRRNSTGRPPKCSFVEMQLVPADALVIQKANGAWPTLLVMELADLLAYTRYDDDPVQYHEARQFLDDLAAANV